MTEQYRTEVDLLGEREVPADAYWGIHTLRAVENFNISNVTISRCAGNLCAVWSW